MRTSIILFLAPFFLALGLPPLYGAAPVMSPGLNRELRLITLVPIDAPLFLGVNPSASKLRLSTTQLNCYTDGLAGRNIEIFNSKITSDLKQVKVIYATAPWPEPSLRALGILYPGGMASSPHGRLLLLADSIERYPEKSVRVINLMERPLMVKGGGKGEELGVNGELVILLNSTDGEVQLEVSISEKQGEWRRALSRYLTNPKHYRSVVILRPDDKSTPDEDAALPDMIHVLDQTSPLPAEPLRPSPVVVP